MPLFTYLLSLFGHNGPYFTLYDLQMKAILDPSLSEYPHLLFHSETSSTKSSLMVILTVQKGNIWPHPKSFSKYKNDIWKLYDHLKVLFFFGRGRAYLNQKFGTIPRKQSLWGQIHIGWQEIFQSIFQEIKLSCDWSLRLTCRIMKRYLRIKAVSIHL